MRNISADLQNDIMAGSIANCIKITLVNGTVHAYTDHNHNLTVDGVTYVPAAGLQKARYTLTADAQVSSQKFGSAWVDAPEADLRGGLFDLATVEVAWASWKNPQHGRLVTFTGQLGQISWTEAGFSADLVSFMKNLAKNVGIVFTSNCRHKLYGTGGPGYIGKCGVNAANYIVAGSISSVVLPKWRFLVVPFSQPDNYFTNGTITFTSGLNTGLSAVIKHHAGTAIDLFLPTAFLVAPGDTFTVQAGCDKTLATCGAKFNNVINFGGFPHISPDVNFQ
jgi:uncharacterized phage protein (TIGR02218 family)